MPCLAQEFQPKPPTATTNHYCKSLSSLIRETYAHCHVPCVRVPAGSGWSSGEDDSDDDDELLDTKQVVLNEMRNRQMKKRSRCSMDSPTLPLSSAAFAWSYTPLDPRTVLEKVSSPRTCVVVDATDEKEKEKVEEAGDDDGDFCDADDESEAFFSVKSFFTRSTSRAATVASSAAADVAMDPPPPPMLLRSAEALERFRDCEGWPFGLCRRPTGVLPLPPLPSTPADSWKWRKSVSSLAASPAHPAAYTHKLTSK
ncbi:hypothetical protein HU200_037756 [Digitaria exilis]|uniref:Uncharacterized protein n=1 Tax=Digitaria exilis TaxID=1010633 RepID=A0A835EJ49_9POAL|nr:hypothetical protein HU200_037756 [Digitaria exilis]CAB3453602.1 unnamed protein product [Digitaria exilis]CAB3457255.1 unnamed protein product [Digitaria exilis]